MTIQQAKQIDLVDYLTILGYAPTKISGQNYWYLSPFRTEKAASFKVNRTLNRWYDFAEGKGGSLVDFGVHYFKCSLSDLLKKINLLDHTISLSSKTIDKQMATGKEEGKVKILSVFEISSYPLVKYLQSRHIPLQIAWQYLKEIRYQIGDKIYYAIGFKNDAGGYELRNPNFKGGSSPKAITFIDNGAKFLSVFEGFFDFLSYLSLDDKKELLPHNFLVLNSTSFFEKSIPKMLTHEQIHLFLDNDPTGQKWTGRAMDVNREKFHDERHRYEGCCDLNEWLMKTKHCQKLKPGLGD